MRTLEDAIIKVGQVDDFMYMIEGAMIDAVPDAQDASTRRLHSLVYILMDQIRAIKEDLEEANGHITVCNAIFAAGHVRELEAEIKRLRASKGK